MNFYGHKKKLFWSKGILQRLYPYVHPTTVLKQVVVLRLLPLPQFYEMWWAGTLHPENSLGAPLPNIICCYVLFLQMTKDLTSAERSRFQSIIRAAILDIVPLRYREDFLANYSCCPPPFFIICISIAQVYLLGFFSIILFGLVLAMQIMHSHSNLIM